MIEQDFNVLHVIRIKSDLGWVYRENVLLEEFSGVLLLLSVFLCICEVWFISLLRWGGRIVVVFLGGRAVCHSWNVCVCFLIQ